LFGGANSPTKVKSDPFDDEFDSIIEKHLDKLEIILPRKKVTTTPVMSIHMGG
jgi:hypothetical protein